jgi:hypothetical protein
MGRCVFADRMGGFCPRCRRRPRYPPIQCKHFAQATLG